MPPPRSRRRKLPLRLLLPQSQRLRLLPSPPPPVAGERPHSYTHHGITVEDPWHWLEDEDYPTVDDEDVLAYLEAENDYFDASHGAPRRA